MRIYLIKSHYSKRFENSLNRMTKIASNSEVIVVQEDNTREKTLNNILQNCEINDTLIVADDINLNKEIIYQLQEFKKDNRVMGLAMKSPSTKLVQNRGFDLIDVDGQIRTRAIQENQNQSNKFPYFKKCFSFTGCLMFIPKEVVKLRIEVPLIGRNRLGEMLYHFILHEKGIEVGIIDNVFAQHFADSTKKNPDPELTFESYSYESQIWKDALKEFDLSKYVAKKYSVTISNSLISFLKNTKNLKIYGAGSITESLLNQSKTDNFDLISGLNYEDGNIFLGKKIYFYENFKFKSSDTLLISVEGLENKVYEVLQPFIKTTNVFFVGVLQEGFEIKYSLESFR